MSTTTTMMGLKVPQMGDPSPGYVSDLSTTINTLDAHDHSVGNGTKVTQAGLNISGTLAMNGQTLSTLRSAQFTPQTSALSSPSDNGSLFIYNGDLYYLNGSNQLVRLSSGPTITGGIGGDYSFYPTAQISYSNSDLTYYFKDSAGNAARLQPLSVALGSALNSSGSITYSGSGSRIFNFTDTSGAGAATVSVGGANIGINGLASQGPISLGGATTAGNITTNQGNITATAGSVSGASITTAGIISTTGPSASSYITSTGNIVSSGNMQAVNNITANFGNIAATSGNITAGGQLSGASASISGNAAVGSLNATGGVLQGSRLMAVRGTVSSSLATGSTTSPIRQFSDGSTPAFAQCQFMAPYAGSVAAMTARIYNSNATAGTATLQTTGLTTNPVAPSTGSFSFSQINSGAFTTYTPGTYTFNAGAVISVNFITSSWTQSATSAGIEITLWVYC